MTPFYFGTSRQPLFGLYHPPTGAADRNRGVVLCHSFGREYILAHRSFRHLTTRLSRAGFHVLRFDYYGCGDSGGDDDEVRLETWQENTEAAVEELRDYADIRRISLLGFRLGAAMAVRAATPSLALDDLVLWEPVIDGPAYLRELETFQREWLRGHDDGSEPVDADGAFEVFGFPVTAALRAEMDTLRMDADPVPHAARVLAVDQSEETTTGPVIESWHAPDRPVVHRHIAAPRFWVKGELNTSQVPAEVIGSLVSWLEEAPA